MGGFGDGEEAEAVFYGSEMVPLQRCFRSIDDRIGVTVVRFQEQVGAPQDCGRGGLLGFALLDWFNKGTRVGRNYGRPIGLANLMLAGVAAISVGAGCLARGAPALAIAAPFGAIALGFAWLVGLSGKSD